MTIHSFEFEYEQVDAEEPVKVHVELDVTWHGAERDVGIMSDYPEVNEATVTINDKVCGYGTDGNLALAEFTEIKDATAFNVLVSRKIDEFCETVEAPEPDYDY